MAAKHVEVMIGAPPAAVWQALTDVESWPRWTASVTRVKRLDDGPLRVGSQTRLKQPRMTAIIWEVTRLEVNRDFTWVGRSPGLTTTARHVLDPAGDGTLLRLSLDHQGRLAGLIARLTGRRTQRYLSLEANGLKASAQAAAAAG